MVIKGTYLNYVKPALLPWLIAAAAVLVALGVAAIVRDLRHGTGRRPTATGIGHWLVWLLLMPIAIMAFVVPPPLERDGATPTAAAATDRSAARSRRCPPAAHRRCRCPTCSCARPPTPPTP